MGKRHFLTLVSVGPGAEPRISTKMFKKGVFVKHPSKKVVSFWCWCEGQLKTHCERVFFPPRTPNDWPIGTRLPQNLTLIKSCCSSSATIMATDLMGNQVVYFLLNAHCVTHHHHGAQVMCKAGKLADSSRGLVFGLSLAAVSLALLLLAAIVGLVILRRSRQAELQQMRSLPQQR